MKAVGNATPFVPGRELEIFERLEREALRSVPEARPSARCSARSSRPRSRCSAACRSPTSVRPRPTRTRPRSSSSARWRTCARRRPPTRSSRQVESGQVEFGVVPIENSSEGVVSHTLDLFVDSPLTIAAEIHVPIHHDLLSRSGRPARDPRGALAPAGARAVPRLARAEPAQHSAADHALDRAGGGARRPQRGDRRHREPDRGRAVRPARSCTSGIEDLADNTTRFLVICGAPAARAARATSPRSCSRSSATQVGALYKALEPFDQHGVNLTRIESRPTRAARLGVRVLLRLRGSPRGREGRRRDPRAAPALRLREGAGQLPRGGAPDVKLRDLVNAAHPRPGAVRAGQARRGARARARHRERREAGVEREPASGRRARAVEAIFAAAENLNRYPDDTCFVLRDAARDARSASGATSSASRAAPTASSSCSRSASSRPATRRCSRGRASPCTRSLAKGAGATPVRVPLDARAPRRRRRRCSRAVTPRTRLLILAQPEQPDRHVARRGGLRDAGARAARRTSCSPPTRPTSSSCAAAISPTACALLRERQTWSCCAPSRRRTRSPACASATRSRTRS